MKINLVGGLRRALLGKPAIIDAWNVFQFGGSDDAFPIAGGNAAATAHFSGGLVAATYVLSKLRDGFPPINKFNNGGWY